MKAYSLNEKECVAALELFSPEFRKRMAAYCPPAQDRPTAAKTLSGRALEEFVELHLESGGTPTTAMMHVVDAITNEAFKVKARIGSGGRNQDAYPSAMVTKYSREAVVSELADGLFLWMTNAITSDVPPSEVLEALELKLQKLELAKENGKLTVTQKGTFYIQKD